MSSLIASQSTWMDALLAGLASFALRSTVILLGAWLAAHALRRSSAAIRHLIWTSAIVGVLVLPVIRPIVPAWNVPLLTVNARVEAPAAAPVTTPASALQAASREVAPGSGVTTPKAEAASTAPVAQQASDARVDVATSVGDILLRVSGTSVLATMWLLVVTLLLARLVIANVRVAAWRRSSHPVEDAGWLALLSRLSRRHRIGRPVVLLENEATDVPVTWGVVYPVILLPAGADEWSEDQRVAVLTHELAHVKRFDALTQMMGQLALSLLWFHPLVWLAVRRMRLEREHACDDFVLVAGARASHYADELLGLARRLVRPAAPAAAALAMARRSELEGRLLAILDPAIRRTAVRRARAGALTISAIALAVPVAAFRPAARVQTSAVTPMSANIGASPSPVAWRGVDTPSVAVERLEQRPESLLRVNQSDALSELSRRFADLPMTRLSMSPAHPLPRLAFDTEPKPIDLETLIEVTRATKRMTSDHEKGQLLALIAARYQRSDALRDAYLESVFTMTSDQERSAALIALLDRDSLPLSSVAQVLKSTAMMTSDMNKGRVLKRISPTVFADTAVQRAYMEAIVGITSDMERAAALGSLVKQQPLSQPIQLVVLQSAVIMTSNTEKANLLLLFLDKQGLADDQVRKAFFKTAESLTADSEYRRIMTAVMR
ncbi:MAG TPA: M56 family metallopeptidase [Gemmatimonadaceae bacterium]|nr:M56 family metallopeptidase [Gemmatimonadaceae bacterium]